MNAKIKLFSFLLLLTGFTVQCAHRFQSPTPEEIEQAEKRQKAAEEELLKKMEDEYSKVPPSVIHAQMKEFSEKDFKGVYRAYIDLFKSQDKGIQLAVSNTMEHLTLDQKKKVLVRFMINNMVHMIGSLALKEMQNKEQQEEGNKEANKENTPLRYNVIILPVNDAKKLLSKLRRRRTSLLLFCSEYMKIFGGEFFDEFSKTRDKGVKPDEFFESKVCPGAAKYLDSIEAAIKAAEKQDKGVIVGTEQDFNNACEEDCRLEDKINLSNSIALAQKLRNFAPQTDEELEQKQRARAKLNELVDHLGMNDTCWKDSCQKKKETFLESDKKSLKKGTIAIVRNPVLTGLLGDEPNRPFKKPVEALAGVLASRVSNSPKN